MFKVIFFASKGKGIYRRALFAQILPLHNHLITVLRVSMGAQITSVHLDEAKVIFSPLPANYSGIRTPNKVM